MSPLEMENAMSGQMTVRILPVLFIITDLSSYIVEAFCLDQFFYGLLANGREEEGKRRKRSSKTLLVPAAYLFVLLILKYMPYIIDALAAYVIIMTAVFFVSCAAYHGNMVIKIYIAVTFLAISYLTHFISTFSYQRLSAFPDRIHEEMLLSGSAEYELYFLICMIFIHVAYIALKGLLLYLPIRLLVKKFACQKMRFPLKETFCLLTPSFTGLLCGFFMQRFPQVFEEASGKKLFEEYPVLYVLIVVNAGILIAGIIIIIILFQNLVERKQEEWNRILLENQITEVTSHIRQVEQLYAGLQGLKHDIRNHMANIGALLETKQYEEAGGYGRRLESAMKRLDYPFKTGHPVTDVILNEKSSSASDYGIAFFTAFAFPLKTNINAFDLSVILNNALSNALEACVREKEREDGKQVFIRISSRRKKNAWLLLIENTYNGKLRLDENGLPVTTKTDKHLHGLGLSNIRMVAEKYYGDIDIKTEENKFILTVLLMCS